MSNDYNREVVRCLVFVSILKGLQAISDGNDDSEFINYLEIPENGKSFYDIIIRNVKENETSNNVVDIAIQYQETLINGKIEFIPKVETISKLDHFFGHREIDAKNNFVTTMKNCALKVANEIVFVLINNEKIALKPLNN